MQILYPQFFGLLSPKRSTIKNIMDIKYISLAGCLTELCASDFYNFSFYLGFP